MGKNITTGVAGGPAAATPWFDAGKFNYFAPSSSLFIVELFLFAWVEVRRYQDMVKPGRCVPSALLLSHFCTDLLVMCS